MLTTQCSEPPRESTLWAENQGWRCDDGVSKEVSRRDGDVHCTFSLLLAAASPDNLVMTRSHADLDLQP